MLQNVSDNRRNVPPEVLQQIVYRVLAQYLDDLMVGRLALNLEVDATTMFAPDRETMARAAEMELRSSDSLENPMFQLLSTSYKIRHLTLQAIAKTFDVEYIDEGLGRLEGQSPWRMLCLRRYDVWWALNRLSLPSEPPNGPDDLCNSPVLAAYLATAVLKREADLIWAFLDRPAPSREDIARIVGPWQSCLLERWESYARTNLAACPDAFRCGALCRRVYDALVGFAIVGLFGVCLHFLRHTWRAVCAVHRLIVERPLAGFARELSVLAEYLLDILRSIPKILEKLDGTPEEELSPTADSIDDMIGRDKYIALIRAISDIADSGVGGAAFEQCRGEARSLAKLFSQRLERLPQEAQSLAYDYAGNEVIDASDALVQETEGEER